MALPIKRTPQLKGKDAERFIQKMVQAEKQCVPASEYKRAIDLFNKMPQIQHEAIPARAR